MGFPRIEQLTEADVISEVRKLQYLYGLKKEIRYAERRSITDTTESVAEHIYGMHILAFYFLEYEDPLRQWDWGRIFLMITLHDIDEIETGDVIGYLKTEAERAAEVVAMHTVKQKAPSVLHDSISSVIDEYEARVTKEALFVRAIDKFEPLVQLYTELGRGILLRERCTIEHSRSIKDEHVKHFASIKYFTETMYAVMAAEGYFYTSS